MMPGHLIVRAGKPGLLHEDGSITLLRVEEGHWVTMGGHHVFIGDKSKDPHKASNHSDAIRSYLETHSHSTDVDTLNLNQGFNGFIAPDGDVYSITAGSHMNHETMAKHTLIGAGVTPDNKGDEEVFEEGGGNGYALMGHGYLRIHIGSDNLNTEGHNASPAQMRTLNKIYKNLSEQSQWPVAHYHSKIDSDNREIRSASGRTHQEFRKNFATEVG